MKLHELFEKWTPGHVVPEKERGKHAGKSIEELKRLQQTGTTEQKREAAFAIRAKRAKGGKWKGVTTK